jgi:hypothetical protein
MDAFVLTWLVGLPSGQKSKGIPSMVSCLGSNAVMQ